MRFTSKVCCRTARVDDEESGQMLGEGNIMGKKKKTKKKQKKKK
jgi:hypothetical protein